MPQYHIPLFPDRYYHVLSRAVGNELLFREEENFRFFLERFQKHIGPVANVFAYCLIPNHFHFLIRIKPEEKIIEHFQEAKRGKTYQADGCSDFIMERFSNFLNSYTKAVNKRFSRKGALFVDYLRRVEIEKESQFSATLFYVHNNPVHHGLTTKIEDWPWSSYQSLLSERPTHLLRDEVLAWFGDRDAYIRFHQQPIDLKNKDDFE